MADVVGLDQFQYQAKAEPPAQSVQPGATYESPWHEPWSEPVRQKINPLLAVALIASGAFAPVFAPLRDVAVASNSWSQPPAQIRQIQYQAWAGPVFIGEAITSDKWFASLSEPVRVKPRLPEGEQQFLAYSESAQFPENITEDRWHQPWSEPVRVKPGLLGSSQPFFFAPASAPIVPFDWLYPYSDPVRERVGLKTHLQSFFAGDTQTIASSALVPWFAPLSEPVRLKIGLGAWLQQSVVFAAEPPVVSFSYYDWLSEPVRQKLGLNSALQQFFTTDTVAIPTSRGLRWYNWLSEPVRLKSGLGVPHHPAFVINANFVPSTSSLLEGYNWWSEPVREKLGLKTYLQQTLAYHPRILPTPSVTATLNATEVNSDVFNAGVRVYDSVTPATDGSGMRVSIIESGGDRGAISSIEET